MGALASELWNAELITKYDLSGPRYTSYPTAVQFNESINVNDWTDAVTRSNTSGAPLSLYFHIPFCDTICYYCACNKIVTANHKKSLLYVDHLLQEFKMQSAFIDKSRIAKQLHWGGGTPTYLNDEQISDIMTTIKQELTFADEENGEYSIEIHPATVDATRIKNLRKVGFNRLSLGIQDFDPAVQNAVNRFNSAEEVKRIFQAAREAEYKSISVDLIYGLPLQTQKSFAATLEQVISLDPDRISLFNYAHMPHLFKTQKQIDTTQLPEPQEKLEILHQSIETLARAGYVYIGMDHFAKSHDELAIAQKQGQLHRNFQGYSTHNDCDLFSFGVSSISHIDGTMFQNTKDLESYHKAIEGNQFPIDRGFNTSDDDQIRKTVISEIICNFSLSFEKISQAFDINFTEYFVNELEEIKELAKDGLLTITHNGLYVKQSGRILVRRICMAFDKYIQKDPALLKKRYSRII